jgi:hypothetical protein
MDVDRPVLLPDTALKSAGLVIRYESETRALSDYDKIGPQAPP